MARMSNPFQIEGPAVISFSGGRTSGLMLRRIMDAGLGKDVHILFSNTGKEREETLQFVHDSPRTGSAPSIGASAPLLADSWKWISRPPPAEASPSRRW